MADNAPAPSGEGSATPAAPDQKAAPATGTEPAKPASGTQGFDPKTLPDEDFQKIFDDPRLFQHDRFKSLNERAKKATDLEKAQEEAENKRLEGEKKYQELAQKHEARANDLQAKFTNTLIDNKIAVEASKLGITDLEAATKLLDRTGIAVNDDGSVVGVEEAVKTLADTKTYLVDKNQVRTIGSSTNPAKGNDTSSGAQRQFKATEIGNPAFYRENEKDIMASFAAGVPIIDDRATRT